jgi:ethanolamine utilization protein EutN
MKLGRVIGTMVASTKPDLMKGLKLLIVRPLTADLRDEGEPFIATDASDQASSGDLVTYEASREAALLHDPYFIPVDHAVVGIVDQHVFENDRLGPSGGPAPDRTAPHAPSGGTPPSVQPAGTPPPPSSASKQSPKNGAKP